MMTAKDLGDLNLKRNDLVEIIRVKMEEAEFSTSHFCVSQISTPCYYIKSSPRFNAVLVARERLPTKFNLYKGVLKISFDEILEIRKYTRE